MIYHSTSSIQNVYHFFKKILDFIISKSSNGANEIKPRFIVTQNSYYSLPYLHISFNIWWKTFPATHQIYWINKYFLI